MRIIVQKFGGTSVTTGEKRNMAVNKVISAIEQGFSPVVVVSAMGRKGEPYATDTLLSLINTDGAKVAKREADLLMCCGEIISAVVMSEAFARKGHKTRVLTGGNAGIITDNSFGNAEVINVKTEKILRVLEQGLIPIVTGFQGMTEEGDYTTLGRGGSDVTAALLGKALKAECVEIYTDVDGIMTADPNIVPGAKIIDEISYNEVFQMADQGAKVVHPRAVEYASEGNIPLIIKNTVSNAPGTVISNSKGTNGSFITGITSTANKTQVVISFPDCCNKSGNRIFELLAEKNICIDYVSILPGQEVFTIDSTDIAEVEDILKQLCPDYRIINNCSKVSLVGNAMRGRLEVMSKLLKTLECNNVSVLQTSNTYTDVWCLVKETDHKKALNELHNAFFCAS